MQIVIDISEEVYNKAKDGMLGEIESMYICGAVTEGTVLSKGHGDLISRNDLQKTIDFIFPYDPMSDYGENIDVVINLIDNAPIVIEADNDNEN